MENNYSKIKSFLQKKKASLLDVVTFTCENTVNEGDEGDKANAAYEQEMSYIFKGRGVNGIKAINEALKRIDEGTFGKCEECGEDISVKRLEVVPFAKLCVGCQEQMERVEG
jgi:RNA polymerase-binding protein DksA